MIAAASQPYVPLWCKSNFSFLEGSSHPEELVEEGSRLGVPSLALTDRDGVYGVVRAHVKARELGVHLIIGAQVTLEDGSHLVLLAQDRKGYGRLCRVISAGRLRSPKGECRVFLEEVCEHTGGLIALLGPNGHWGTGPARDARRGGPCGLPVRIGERPGPCAGWERGGHKARPYGIGDLKDAFSDRLYAMLVRHRRPEEIWLERRLRVRAAHYGLPLVAANEVLYHIKVRRALQDVVTCVRHGVSLAEAGRRINPNAEHVLKTPYAFGELFEDDRAAVLRTLEVAERCTFDMDDIRYRYPSERLPSGTTSSEWLRELTWRGARERYGGDPPADVAAQLEKELTLIDELDYPGYFLTMHEIVRFCRERDILCQGRGSAANSAVCYCLFVTAVDPVRMKLLFERFISKERAEPPDIDLDIEHARREEVIQHVYGKYGRSHAAMVANVIRYRPRSAVRDVGKALGIPETALDRLAKLLPHHGDVRPEMLRQAGLDPEQPAQMHLVDLSNEILDFPRHLSIHPGGFLLGHERVDELVPIENATMEDRTVIQWDKEDVEALGLFKVDLLGLGALTMAHDCFDLLAQHRGVKLSMATLPSGDPKTYEMIRAADTVGVFQIESRAQMAMLPRLSPETFYDLVIEVSIVRPGPISGGMVHPYLKRRRGEEPVDYPHPSLEPVLEKTLGVPLFQEQVMKLAVVAADYTPGEADQLRRDMAAWRRTGRIEKHRGRLISRMTAKGIRPEFAERVFEQIRGFGEYGFPESHAASFALISYATSYLKCHFPVEFACAILNAQPMGFYSPSTLVEDAKHHGVEVRPIDVTASEWRCTLEPISPDVDTGANDAMEGQACAGWERGGHKGLPYALRMGLRYVKGMREEDGERIVAARRERPVTSFENFVHRTGLGEGILLRLAEAGALETLDPDRRAALWDARRHVKTRERSLPLFDPPETAPPFQPLELFETIGWDYSTTGHSSRGHPLETIRGELDAQGLPTAQQLNRRGHGQRASYAGAVICRQRPGTAKGVVFMTLEDETGFVNALMWPSVWEKYALVVKTNPLLGLTGRLESQQGVVHLVVDKVWLPKIERRPADAKSRDFR